MPTPPRAAPQVHAASLEFELASLWRLDAPIDQVWATLSDVGSWPRWWPAVRRVQLLEPGDAQGLGCVRRVEWVSRLRLPLVSELELLACQSPERLLGRTWGPLVGETLWQLHPQGRATEVHCTWNLPQHRPWMHRLAPLLEPVLRWNHDGMMRRGGVGLARYLGVNLLEARALG